MKKSKKITIFIIVFFLVIALIIIGRYGVGLYFKKKFSKRPPPGVIIETISNKSFSESLESYCTSLSSKTSSFKVKKLLNSTCFVEIDIFTGRTHQIRVQSSHIGHPILNDAKYGDKNFNKTISSKKIKRMALHSSEIRFVDQDGIKIHAKSEIDEAFTMLLDTLK